MKPITCIFFGRSGSGKGTQAELLMNKIKAIDPATKLISVEMGGLFRSFVKESESYTAKKVKEIISAGRLIPASLAIWLWSNFLINEFSGNEHLVIDGIARREDEAPILDSALQFYGREKPIIFFIDVPVPEVTERLLKRGRHDDKEEKIAERLRWFESDVMKSVHFFETNPYYRFINIDGDQTIENVHKDILKAIGL